MYPTELIKTYLETAAKQDYTQFLMIWYASFYSVTCLLKNFAKGSFTSTLTSFNGQQSNHQQAWYL